MIEGHVRCRFLARPGVATIVCEENSAALADDPTTLIVIKIHMDQFGVAGRAFALPGFPGIVRLDEDAIDNTIPFAD